MTSVVGDWLIVTPFVIDSYSTHPAERDDVDGDLAVVTAEVADDAAGRDVVGPRGAPEEHDDDLAAADVA